MEDVFFYLGVGERGIEGKRKGEKEKEREGKKKEGKKMKAGEGRRKGDSE